MQCGCRIHQREDFGIELDQCEYLEGMGGIQVKRGRQEDEPVTESERTQLRGVVGGLLWRANQSGPGTAAGVSLMASEICQATAGTLKEANLLLKRAQDRKNDKIIIHPFPEQEELVVGTWVDASWANRRDGGSTGGFVYRNDHRESVAGQRRRGLTGVMEKL